MPDVFGAPVRVHDMKTGDDLGIAHDPHAGRNGRHHPPGAWGAPRPRRDPRRRCAVPAVCPRKGSAGTRTTPNRALTDGEHLIPQSSELLPERVTFRHRDP